MSNLFVGKHFKLGKKLNSGSFGEIYRGVDCLNGTPVAIKLESRKSNFPQLVFESKVYRILKGGTGIPKMHWTGKEGDFNVMVMELLGPSLEDLFGFCGRRFSLKTTLMLADQMITRIEYLHSRNMIHRDIKPDNFVVGTGKLSNLIFVIDFGLAMKYRHHKTHEHIEYSTEKNLTGTARYASINAHCGVQQSRRDDIESLGYVFVYFMKGSLPWQGLNKKNREENFKAIQKLKESTSVDDLCRDLPNAFAKYITYARSLSFNGQPDYVYLKRLFRELLSSSKFQMDLNYDWIQPSKGQDTKSSPKESPDQKKQEDEEIDPAKRKEAALRKFYSRGCRRSRPIQTKNIGDKKVSTSQHSKAKDESNGPRKKEVPQREACIVKPLYGRPSPMLRTKSTEIMTSVGEQKDKSIKFSRFMNRTSRASATNRHTTQQVRVNRKPGTNAQKSSREPGYRSSGVAGKSRKEACSQTRRRR